MYCKVKVVSIGSCLVWVGLYKQLWLKYWLCQSTCILYVCQSVHFSANYHDFQNTFLCIHFQLK